MNDNVLKIRKKIISILKCHDVKKASVFGSFARGEENKKSDIDILIEFKNSKNKSLLDLVRLKIELEKALGKKVDVVEFSSIKPLLKEKILKEQSLIL
jgi:uncharacterized protein